MSNQRLVFLDTETTGLEIQNDERVIEIAAIEVFAGIRTGSNFYTRLNPDRRITEDSSKVHGITDDELKHEPRFSQIVDELLTFIRDSKLVMHNAAFDVGFLDSELKRAGRKERIQDMCEIVDSLELARERYPGQLNNLDVLARRLKVELKRDKHDAMLDASILASVYMAMTAQQSMGLFDTRESTTANSNQNKQVRKIQRVNKFVWKANEAECAEHEKYMAKLKQFQQCI